MTEIDVNILERARAGDRQAHTALYRAFAPMVYTLACRMLGSRSLAEDVLQDSFVEVLRKADQFRGDAGIGGWIKRIAINKCLSQLRSPWAKRRSALPEADAFDAVLPIGGAPDRRAEVDAGLEHAFMALGPIARAVVWLHDAEGYTHEEIAALMGRSTSFSKSQLARAHRQLRDISATASKERETEPCLGTLKTV